MSAPVNNTAIRQARVDPFEIAGDISDTAERITIPVAEATTIVTSPKDIDHLWVEDEYEQLTLTQDALWEAAKAEETKQPLSQAAGLELQAGEAEYVVARSRELLDQSHQLHLVALRVLSPFRRRAAGSKRWYQLAKGIIFVGDLAGFATAAIWLGELPFIAITLAASAAAATVVAGLIGSDISDTRRRLLRERPVEELTPEQLPFKHLFTASDRGGHIVKQVILVSLLTALTVSIGIGVLRGVVDDPLVGVVFAGIALAVAGGSFLVSFAGADEVADLIEHYAVDYQKHQVQHRKLSESTTWRQWADVKQQATSVEHEFTSRGRAAVEHMRALKWRILRRNPSHAGHGPRAGDAVGRTPRRGVK